MDAMILAAGRGQRLRPLTDTLPKPLIKVANKPIIEHLLEALARQGFDNIVINLNYLGEKIRQTLGDGSRFGLRIHYSEEYPDALETAGGIRQAMRLLPSETLLVINGDIITDMDFSHIRMPDAYAMHLILVPNPEHHRGDFSLARQSPPYEVCERIADQPSYTFAGVGRYRTQIFESLGRAPTKLATLIKHYIATRQVSAELYHGTWIDAGNFARLAQAERMFSD